MKRFRLELTFDGKRYSGWQKQADARTIQGSLLSAAAGLWGGEPDAQGNGRTDAGVHGLRYTAHLDVPFSGKAGEIRAQLNSVLPHDITVLSAAVASPHFHARHNCLGRSYLFQLDQGRSVFRRHYAWQTGPLNLAAMREAAASYAGMHDFTAFTDRQAIKNKSPLAMINQVGLEPFGDLLLFRVVGSHFLWKMVRRMVGVLVAVGRGEMPPGMVARLLAGPAEGLPNLSRLTAPAHGLFFEQAFYDQESMERFLASSPLGPDFY
ncbi:MAG: tRNA pseudouridine(38-40) synthase TruA [Thermodesulfobacteriota bacterium]